MANQGAENQPEGSDVNRRRFLKAAGVAAGVSSIGSAEVASARKNDKHIGKVLFIEVSLEHQTSLDGSLIHYDNFLEYSINESAQQLRLTKFADDSTRNAFREHNVVVKAREFGSPSVVDFRDRPESVLTITTDRNMNPSTQLQLEDEYRGPDVNIELERNHAMGVSVEGQNTTLDTQNERQVETDERKIEVRRPTNAFKEVYDPRQEAMKKARKYSLEQATVRPIVTVRNRGQLDVSVPETGGA